MSVNCHCLSIVSIPSSPLSLSKNNKKLYPNSYSYTPKNYSFSSPTFTCSLHVTVEDVVAITQNKVLLSAGISAVVGQFSKPLTSVLLYGNNLDFRAIVQAGLIMYDAQGVRREVGIHARTINRTLLEAQLKSSEKDGEDIIESVQGQSSGNSSLFEEPNALGKQQTTSPVLLGSRLQNNATKMKKDSVRTSSYVVLKESIGHTEVEVVAGALLGIIVSFVVHAVM